MSRTTDPSSPTIQLHPRVPRFIGDKIEELIKQVRPSGHLHMLPQDIIGALVDAADAGSTAKALKSYAPKAGQAMVEQDEYDSAQAKAD